jgi:valyl-tRNA synthetase
MPFVSEEIYSYLPKPEADALVIHSFPETDESLIDEEAEREIGEAIALTRALRRWRQLADVPVKQILTARADGGRPHELVSRLAKVEFSDDGGEPMATVGGIELLETEGVDPEAVQARIEERRGKLRAEVKRGEGKLGNESFVDKAPADVVDAEREKLAAYRAELEELGG